MKDYEQIISTLLIKIADLEKLGIQQAARIADLEKRFGYILFILLKIVRHKG
ncbi:MAG: hypothetical protein H0T84_00625 [Tatlockia sp.]|nr:hypothetical protein [Tatlockia sp.]